MLNIRPIKKSDIEAIKGISVESGVFKDFEIDELQDQLTDYFLSLEDQVPDFMQAVLVAEVLQQGEASLVAYAYFGKNPITEHTAELFWICARKDAPKGAAARLFAEVEAYSRKEFGCRLLSLESSSAQTPERTFRFWSKMKLTKTAFQPDFYGPGDGRLFFQKDISSHTPSGGAPLWEPPLVGAPLWESPLGGAPLGEAHKPGFGFLGAGGAIETPEARKYLYAAEVEGRGRGLFSKRDIARGEIIDITPVILLPPEELPAIKKTQIKNYYFEYADSPAVALGMPSLLNHSKDANVHWHPLRGCDAILFYATRAIPHGTELCFDYTGGGDTDLLFAEDGSFSEIPWKKNGGKE